MARRGENIYKRRDGRYEGRYVIGKTKDGKTRFGYVYARQYAEVRRLLLEKKMQHQKKRGYRAKQHITLSDWMNHWMENEILGSIKPSSYQTYHRQINRHLLPHLGGYDLSELTPAIIHDFIEKLAKSGLVNRTIKGIYRLLAAALRSAQEQGQIGQNPCRKIKISQLKFLYPLKTLVFPAFSSPWFGPFPSFFPLREEMRETFFRPFLQPYPAVLRKFA